MLTAEVVHPAAFTYKLPDNVSFAEGAMIEPFAVGMQAATRAKITPGDVALVIGCGPIGIMTAIAALAGGCSRVIISDLSAPKLAIAGQYAGITPVNIKETSLKEVVAGATDGWGADVIFEASGSPRAYEGIFDLLRPGGTLVLVGSADRAGQFRCTCLDLQGSAHRNRLPLCEQFRPCGQPDCVRQGRPQAADH